VLTGRENLEMMAKLLRVPQREVFLSLTDEKELIPCA